MHKKFNDIRDGLPTDNGLPLNIELHRLFSDNIEQRDQTEPMLAVVTIISLSHCSNILMQLCSNFAPMPLIKAIYSEFESNY